LVGIGRDWEGEEGRDALLVSVSCTLVSSSSRLEERNREVEEGCWERSGRRGEDEEVVDDTHGGGGSSCTGKKAWLNGTGVLEHFLGCIWRDTSASKTFVVGATIQCDFYGWTMIFGGSTISYWRQVGRDR
jgi:hypothetical protein